MTTALEPIRLPSASRVGQGTVVEQTRAIAEVQAAIMVARQFPRDVQVAIRGMQDACKQPALANRAFYRFPRAGQTVTGPTVHLARELARCYGNIQYGLVELRRDDAAAQSEMLVFAWDVETNTRSSHTFIVPHMRDKAGGPVVLTDMRDIYEANTNAAARRVREAIYAILPQWFVEDAKTLCTATLENGGGVPLPKRISEAIEVFGALGVTERQLAEKLGRESSEWNAHDVAQLGVIYTSLRQGEVSKDDEFPQPRLTAADIVASQPNGKGEQPASAKPQQRREHQPAAPATEGARPEPHIATGQIGIIGSHGKRLGFEEHELGEYVALVGILAGVPGLTDIAHLTQEQGQQAQDRLGRCKDRPALVALTQGEIVAPDGGDQ